MGGELIRCRNAGKRRYLYAFRAAEIKLVVLCGVWHASLFVLSAHRARQSRKKDTETETETKIETKIATATKIAIKNQNPKLIKTRPNQKPLWLIAAKMCDSGHSGV